MSIPEESELIDPLYKIRGLCKCTFYIHSSLIRKLTVCLFVCFFTFSVVLVHYLSDLCAHPRVTGRTKTMLKHLVDWHMAL